MPVAPPRPKGPPLNALRAFEAAARLGGFANAADELSVTPGAISQHIRALEGWAGTALFERHSQGVRLTRAGAALIPQFTRAFDEMGEAVRALRAMAPEPQVHIAVLPSVAQLWLTPRLPSIRAELPGVKLSVSALETPPNLARGLFDLSLFIRPADTDASLTPLVPDTLAPVCAPHVAEALKTPADLVDHALLQDATWSDDWALWARRAHVTLPNLDSGPRFSLYAIAVDEARAGAGVLMGHAALVAGSLERGELVMPFDLQVPSGASLMLELPPRPTPIASKVAALLYAGLGRAS
ncbi:LysR family transcriptional regulator [Roseovarius aestuarii]|nr:LysR family transcriptional regulator [Roseovarius aestuarii]